MLYGVVVDVYKFCSPPDLSQARNILEVAVRQTA
jgi:hypothetical protein